MSPVPFEERIYMDPTCGCWLWTGLSDDGGYGLITIRRRHHRAHRWFWVWKNGPIPAGKCALHKCDTPACVNPDHLFIGTRRDNVADMVRKERQSRGEAKSLAMQGKAARGERHSQAKLTNEQALQIFRDTRRVGRIARAFGISHVTVSNIKRGRRWAHLTGASGA